MDFKSKVVSTKATFLSLLGQSKNLKRNYDHISSWEAFVSKHMEKLSPNSASLDLGCGSFPRNPFGADIVYGVDIRKDLNKNVIEVDLTTDALPFNAKSFDFCTAFNFLEHVPRHVYYDKQSRFPFLELMNEIYRILKPGGLMFHVTPAFPSKEVFMDPTHVNFITEDTIPSYFCSPHNWANKLGYGFHGCFNLVDQKWLNNAYLVGLYKADK